MTYNIVYSAQAKRDLRSIYEYIAFKLLAPEAAGKQAQRIMNEVLNLNEMPMRYKLYGEEPWSSYGLRVFPIGNYLVFYIVLEQKNVVNIVRIMFGGRDINEQLKETLNV